MYTENELKERLSELYKTAPYIHMDISLERPNVKMKNVCVKLVGVYKHIFQIEMKEEKKGNIEKLSIQYGDVIAGIVKIAEL